MSDEKKRDPNEQALRDHADMIEASCRETPQLRRRIKRLRAAADRIDTLTADLAETTADRDRLREVVEWTANQWTERDQEKIDEWEGWGTEAFGDERYMDAISKRPFCQKAQAALAAREQQAGANGGE